MHPPSEGSGSDAWHPSLCERQRGDACRPVSLATWATDMMLGCEWQRLPAMLQQHLPEILPDLTRLQLYAVSSSQEVCCELFTWHAGDTAFAWGDDRVTSVTNVPHMNDAVVKRCSHLDSRVHTGGCELLQPVLINQRVTAVAVFSLRPHIDAHADGAAQWAQAVTSLLWAFLRCDELRLRQKWAN